MPNILSLIEIKQWSEWLTFATIAVPIIIAAIKWVNSVLTEINKLKNMKEIELSYIEEIRKELRPNGGSSLRDAINNITKQLSALEFAQQTTWDFNMIPMFRANSNGDCTWVNQPYQDMVGRGKEYLLSHGWISCLHPDDRKQILEEWREACADSRNFDMTYRFLDIDQNVIKCRVRAFGSSNTGYIGFVYKVS